MLNLRRTALGRALVAVREKDFAAAVIGVQSFYYKLVAFATSSFIGGVSGAMLVFTFYRAVTPEQFAVNVSIELLAMVIVGGLGSIIGSFFGAAFILLLPGHDEQPDRLAGAQALGLDIGVETLAHIPTCVYGALIIVVAADRADGPGQDVRQRAQLPDGLALRLRPQVAALNHPAPPPHRSRRPCT